MSAKLTQDPGALAHAWAVFSLGSSPGESLLWQRCHDSCHRTPVGTLAVNRGHACAFRQEGFGMGAEAGCSPHAAQIQQNPGLICNEKNVLDVAESL